MLLPSATAVSMSVMRSASLRMVATAPLRRMLSQSNTAGIPSQPEAKMMNKPLDPNLWDEQYNDDRGPLKLQHFRTTSSHHPLKIDKKRHLSDQSMRVDPGTGELAWDNPTQNHVWPPEELHAVLKDPPKHKPQGVMDLCIRGIVRGCYHTFNFFTGYDKQDPSPKSCEYRLIILESIAGVPGMVGGSIRHFRSLRSMHRDHGWIHTLLEEAENERMHLLICLKMFKASNLVRGVVIAGQMTLLPILTLAYVIKPKAVHRFVGYLEETAVETYTGILDKLDDPTSELHQGWAHLPAPLIARLYYRLDDNALWPDVLKNIAADETNHRDVNHTFAGMKDDDPNPYVVKHNVDAANAWRISQDKKHAIAEEDRIESLKTK